MAVEGILVATSILLNRTFAWILLVLSTFVLAAWLANRGRDSAFTAAARGELVRIFDEAKKLRGDVFTEVSSGAYSTWRDKASRFIETVFGGPERIRFESDQGELPKSLHDVMALRMRALEHLLDRKSEWDLQVNRNELEAAIRQRETYDEGDQIVVAGTPAEQFAQGVRPRAPIRIRVERHPAGVIQIPAGGERSVAVYVRIHNEHPDDLTDIGMNFAVPKTVGLSSCGPDGSQVQEGRIIEPPDLDEHYWQHTAVRLYGGGWVTEFCFELALRDAEEFLTKTSLRIPGFVSEMKYGAVPVEGSA